MSKPIAWIYQNEYLVWKRGDNDGDWQPLYTSPAPDLLASLKQADQDFKSLGFDSDGTYRAHIRAVIAKAGGEV